MKIHIFSKNTKSKIHLKYTFPVDIQNSPFTILKAMLIQKLHTMADSDTKNP